MWTIAASLLVAAQGHRTDYSQQALADEITALPGLSSSDAANYKMFSGYINVDKADNRSIFYWFVESLNDAANDPVALWTNGGPGCSGLGGFFTEQGPFRPNQFTTLYVNKYSWVNVANMLFIEAPAGVGFSFSGNTADYTTNDSQTAVDNYHMIQGWLQKFSNYANNSFYITSESYGGHYMPTLAKEIVLGNKAGGQPQINFKGFFVGNPFTDPAENERGMYDTWYGHQLISKPAWEKFLLQCQNGLDLTKLACLQATRELNDQVGSAIDPYALDFPVCTGVNTNSKMTERVWFMKHVIKDALGRPVPGIYKKLVAQLEANLVEAERRRLSEDGDLPAAGADIYYPCESDWMIEYLNRPNVQDAIHAKRTIWKMCASQVRYSGESMKTPMEPVYDWLIKNAPELRITIVSGDDDSVCGTLGTQSWIWNMNFTVDTQNNWKVWYDSTGQTGGYVTKFVNALDLVTVHTAGHMIPETQPMRSLEVFSSYLKGTI